MDDFEAFQEYANNIKKYNVNSVTKFIEIIFMATNFLIIFINVNFKDLVFLTSLCIIGTLSGVWLIYQFGRLLWVNSTNKSITFANSVVSVGLIALSLISMFIVIGFYLLLLNAVLFVKINSFHALSFAHIICSNQLVWMFFVLQVYYDFGFFLMYVPKLGYRADNIVTILKNNVYLNFLSSENIIHEKNIIFKNFNVNASFSNKYIPITEKIRQFHVTNLKKLSQSSINELEMLCNTKVNSLSTPFITLISTIGVMSVIVESVRKYIFNNVFHVAKNIFSIEFENNLMDMFLNTMYVLMVVVVLITFIIYLINKEEVPTYKYILSIIDESRL